MSAFACGCTSLSDVEHTLAGRATPTYLVMSGEEPIWPGTAAFLPDHSTPIVSGDWLPINQCGFNVELGPAIPGYEKNTLNGGPIFHGVYWFPHSKHNSEISTAEVFTLFKAVSPTSNVVKITFSNSILVRFDEPKTFISFLDSHPGISIEDTILLMQPCTKKIKNDDYRIISHLVISDMEVEFRWAIFKKRIRPSDIAPDLKKRLEDYGLTLDEDSGTLRTFRPFRVARFGQLRLNSVGRFGPAPPSSTPR